eukprot:COSAG06_NODE_23743_length_683_cov_0.573630_3_plen_68_part_01
MQQLAAFPTENCLKHAVSCAKRGGNLASYTETNQPLTFDAAGRKKFFDDVILWGRSWHFFATDATTVL